MDARLENLKQQANLILLGQFAIVVLVSTMLWSQSFYFFYSALAGGVAGIIPQAVFAKYFLVSLRASQAKRILARFFMAEILKWFCVIAALITVKLMGCELKAVVFGFIVSQLAFWIAPLCLNRKQRVES